MSLLDRHLAKVGKTRADFDLRSKVGKALHADGVADSRELRRVLELPRREPEDEAIDELSLELCPSGAERLWPLQALGLLETADLGGALGGLGCGDGKTLWTAVAPTLVDARRPLLVVPGGLRTKTLHAFADLKRRGWRVAPLVCFEPEPTEAKRRAAAKLKRPRAPKPGTVSNPPPPGTVILISYTELALASNDGVLFALDPDLVELDEAHNVACMNAAAKRLDRFIVAKRPRVVVLSGSWLDEKLERVHHFMRWAYGREGDYRMPLPRTLAEVKQWGRAVDEQPPLSEIEPLAPGALSCFGETSSELRQGLSAWMRNTPGCIGSTDASCGASILAHMHRPKLSKPCRELIAAMQTGTRPDGVELEPHMQAAGEVQAALGMWYGWKKPGPDAWLKARRAWYRFVRNVAGAELEGFDTYLQIWRQYGHGAPGEVREGRAWGEIKDTFEPERTTNWIDTSQLEAAIELAGKGDPCLIWTDIVAVGEKLDELGVRYYGEKGCDARGRYVEDVEDGTRTIALSLKANMEGRDKLKSFHRALYLTPLPKARWCEQSISRVHRPGQRAGVCELIMWCPTDRFRRRLEAAKLGAREAQEKSGQRQRLLLADWSD